MTHFWQGVAGLVLCIPQEEEESQPPNDGGRAESSPMQGVGLLVQQCMKEQGRQPAQGDMLRGPVPGTRKMQQACMCVQAGVVVHSCCVQYATCIFCT